MKTKQIKLNENEFWPLLNILNEVCYGIKITNFENSIGAKKQTVVDFLDTSKKEERKKEITLRLNDVELKFLKNSFDEVLRQIDEWEFQTRIGISTQEARKIHAILMTHEQQK